MRNATYARAAQHPAPGQPPWPVLTDLSGELLIDRATLKVTGASAKLQGVPGVVISRADAQIPI